MPKAPRTYERLTRPASSFGSYRSLWLAADHLVMVTSTGYSEDYQRLQFSDIRGFFVVASDRRLAWHAPWAIGALFSGVFIANTLFSGGTPAVSGTIFALCLVFMAWNQMLGPGCTTFVITGVQTATLPSLVRLPKTRRVLARLRPLIAGFQAELPAAAAAVPPADPPPLL